MATFLVDTFTEASDTALGSHTPDTGGTWHQHPSLPQGMTVVASEGRVRGNSGSSSSGWYNDAAPGSTEYDVEATIRAVSGATDQYFVGLIARADPVATTYYQVYYQEGLTPRFVFERVVGGSVIFLGEHPITLSKDTDYTLKLEIRDAAKKVYLDNVEILSSTNNDITASGFAGIRGRLGSRIDNLSAADTTAAGVTVTPSGVSATGSVGTVQVNLDATVTLTGVAGTGAVGTATVALDSMAAVEGVSATGAVGSVTVNIGGDATATPAGVSATGAVGDVAVVVDGGAAVTGVSATGAVGTVTVTGAGDALVPLTGVAAEGQVGTVAVAFDMVLAVAGVAAAGQVGAVTVKLFQWEEAADTTETWTEEGAANDVWTEAPKASGAWSVQ